MLNIIPVHDEQRDCVEDIIASIANWWELDFDLIFADPWGFHFMSKATGSNETLAERIRPWAGENQYGLLHKYQGIRVIRHHAITHEEVLEMIKEQLKLKRPVAVYMDSYWCNWTPNYKKSHVRHCCLVVGLEESEENLFCVDPNFSKGIEKLNMEDFKSGYAKRSIHFEKAGKELTEVDRREVLLYMVEKVQKCGEETPFQCMRTFAKEICEANDLADEVHIYKDDILMCPLFIYIMQLGTYRLKISNMLKNLGERQGANELDDLAARFQHSGSQWKKAGMTLYKGSMTGNISLVIPKIANILNQLADFEEQLHRDMQKSC